MLADLAPRTFRVGTWPSDWSVWYEWRPGYDLVVVPDRWMVATSRQDMVHLTLLHKRAVEYERDVSLRATLFYLEAADAS